MFKLQKLEDYILFSSLLQVITFDIANQLRFVGEFSLSPVSLGMTKVCSQVVVTISLISS
jgi:hypothetical protein